MDLAVEARDRWLARFERDGPRGGPEWLVAFRRSALDRFAARGFPTLKTEGWRFTNLAPLLEIPFEPPAGAPAGLDRAAVDAVAPRPWEGTELVFVNGRYAPDLSRPAALPAGVEVGSLGEVLARRPGALEGRLGAAASDEPDPFGDLNGAFFVDGAFVRLGRGIRLTAPLHLLYLSAAAGGGCVAHPRSLIVAEEGSEATVIESFAPVGEPDSFTNATTEIAAGEGARVDAYRLQREGPRTFHVGSTAIRQERSSRVEHHLFSFGGRLVRSNVSNRLEAEGAETDFDGLYVAAGSQHMDLHTSVDHVRPRATSRELYKGILGGKARGVFQGRIVVRPDAQKSDAAQMNLNLLLTEGARIDTKPQLEIRADDVKAAHGAAVGKLDADALFYLRCRGIPEAGARSLLTRAFSADLTQKVRPGAVREAVLRLLAAALPIGGEEGAP